jgi:hypothetical protein
MCNGIPVICTPTPGLKENCGEVARYVGTQIVDADSWEPSVKIGTVKDWVRAISEFDNKETYRKYSLLCRARAAERDPVTELEALHEFILNARF